MIEQILKELAQYPKCQLIAVSKLQSIEKIRDAYKRGITQFGENYLQEVHPKMIQLSDLKIKWHMIGNIQKNKVKLVVGFFEYLHTVDSLELATKINALANEKKIIQKILIQVNLSKEVSKNGIDSSELEKLVNNISKLPNLKLEGLMTMPPLFSDSELSRPYFRNLKNLANSLNLPELSMGTSSDYKVALSEGATMIRVGSLLFGERPRKHH